jgi:hypothetical protein
MRWKDGYKGAWVQHRRECWLMSVRGRVITHARKGKCMLIAETRTLMLSEMHMIFHVSYSSKLSDRDAHENGCTFLFSYIL